MPLKVTIAVGKTKTVELDLANKNATLKDLKEAFSKKVRTDVHPCLLFLLLTHPPTHKKGPSPRPLPAVLQARHHPPRRRQQAPRRQRVQRRPDPDFP